ncbi:MAG: TonB-dependent siderophore receptor [Xylophilus ampelinus]
MHFLPRHPTRRTPLACAALAAFAAAPALHAQPAPSAPRPFDLPAAPLADALPRFARQAGLQLMAAPALVQQRQGRAVAGLLPPQEALAQLLRGSGLAGRIEGTTVVVERAAGAVGALPEVRVTAAAATEDPRGPALGYLARRSLAGTKTDTPLLEIPQSVSVVTRQQIEDTGAQKLRDVLNYTAGVTATEGADRTTDSFVLRGFQATSFGSVYRDGMKYLANVYDGVQEPYGAERVEVLRGASSILFGQTSPGGVINVVSKQPTVDPLREVRVEYGSHDRRQVATDLGGALDADGRLSYRLVALARASGTMVDHVPDDRAYLAPSLRWQPGAATSLTLSATYQKTRTAYVYGLPAQGTIDPNPNGAIPTRRFTGEPGYTGSDVRYHDVGYRLEHAFNDTWKLRQNVRYFQSRNDFPSIGLGGFVPGTNLSTVTRSAQDRLDDGRLFTADTQAEARFATGAVAHALLAGIDYTDRSARTERYNRTATPLNLFAPAYGGALGPRVPAPNSSVTDSERTGLYLQDQLKWERWVLLVGARHEKATDRTTALFRPLSQAAAAEATTGRAGLVYLADDGVAPFVGFSQSFEPVAGVDRLGRGYVPTRGEQYEAGVRWQPPGSATLVSAAVYQLTQRNVSTPDPVAPTQFSVQTGEIRSRGLELEAKAELGRRWSVTAAYAYTDAQVTRSNVAAEVGQRRGATPRNMASAWAMYRFGPVGAGTLRGGAGVRHVGGTLGLFNAGYQVPPFTVADAMLAYDQGPWQFMLRVNNLADKAYVASCTYACFYGERRMAVASLGYRW